jgi:flagellar L-ring protein precursor FlgH
MSDVMGRSLILGLLLASGGALAEDKLEQWKRMALVIPPEPDPAPPGSLWNENTARVLVGMDANARRAGDLITVNITEETRSEILASTESKRESSVGGGVGSLFGLDKGITKANSNMGGELGLSVEGAAEFKGDGKTAREGMLVGRLTCKVIEVQPNGNLIVYGWKEVRSNRETQYLMLTGAVRPQDIKADNTVDSHLLAEAHLEYSGAGTVSDKQGPGIGQRIVDHAWPF